MNWIIAILTCLLVASCYNSGGYIKWESGTYLCWTTGCAEVKSQSNDEGRS